MVRTNMMTRTSIMRVMPTQKYIYFSSSKARHMEAKRYVGICLFHRVKPYFFLFRLMINFACVTYSYWHITRRKYMLLHHCIYECNAYLPFWIMFIHCIVESAEYIEASISIHETYPLSCTNGIQ